MASEFIEIEDTLCTGIYKFRAISDLLMVADTSNILKDTLSGIACLMNDELTRMQKQVDQLTAFREALAK
jgi:hypothetical protein